MTTSSCFPPYLKFYFVQSIGVGVQRGKHISLILGIKTDENLGLGGHCGRCVRWNDIIYIKKSLDLVAPTCHADNLVQRMISSLDFTASENDIPLDVSSLFPSASLSSSSFYSLSLSLHLYSLSFHLPFVLLPSKR